MSTKKKTKKKATAAEIDTLGCMGDTDERVVDTGPAFGRDYWEKQDRLARRKALGYAFYNASLPFVFGIIVNLTGDYLTAGVVTSSLFLFPWTYKSFELHF